jgi:hypothetical protein
MFRACFEHLTMKSACNNAVRPIGISGRAGGHSIGEELRKLRFTYVPILAIYELPTNPEQALTDNT